MTEKLSIVIPALGEIPPLRKIFLVSPRHALFLVGREKYLYDLSSSYGRALLMPGVLVGLMLLIGILASASFSAVAVLVFIFGLLGVVTCIQTYRNRRLCELGKLIQGRIISHKTEQTVRIFGIFGVFFYSQPWVIRILCGFRTPEGKVMSKRVTLRHGLSRHETIHEGMPIVVLYLDDWNYKIL